MTKQVLVVCRLRKYRKDFSSILSSSSSNLTKNRFTRLFIVSTVLIIVLVPTQIYLLFGFVKQINVPYSWKAVHGPNWGDIILMPFHGVVGPEYWIQIVVGFLIFAIFGTGKDALEEYRQWLLKLGLGRFFPSLHLTVRERRHLKSTTNSQTSSFGSQVRMLKKGFSRSSITSLYAYLFLPVSEDIPLTDLHSHKSKSSATSPPLSPPAPPYDSLPPLQLSHTGSPIQLTAADNHLLEPLPPIHSSPSRFHNFFRAAHATAPERQMAGGLGGFGVSTLPRMDPYSRDYDPV